MTASSDLPRIVAVALRHDDLVLSLPAPARHHNLISACNFAHIDCRAFEQGFLGSDGRFYSRFQALQRALHHRQTSRREGPRELYSEDLW